MLVRLLGPVAASVASGDVPLGGPKQRTVFALLALNAGQVVSLDRLVYELWRDEPPAQATVTLQGYVSRLRRVLAEYCSDDPDAPRIVTRTPGWVLHLPVERVDALAFETALAEARSHIAGGSADSGAQTLRRALALWGGTPLAGLDTDAPFVRDEQGRWEQLRLSAVEAQLEAELAVGATETVIDIATRFVGDNPFRERAWCALMLALYRCGRQADALAEAARLRALMSTELGLDPSAQLRTLEQRILRQDPTLDRPTPAEWPLPGPSPSPSQAAADHASVAILAGRADALAAIDAAIAGAAVGRGGLLLFRGAAGIGKSALLGALTLRMRAAGGTVVRGAGVEVGTPPALWPWVSVVREVMEQFPALSSREDLMASRAALGVLDPAGHRDAPSLSGRDAALAQTRLYRAVIDLMVVARLARPLALVFDDAQWFDDETLDLLATVVDELVARGVLIAVGARPPELSAHDRLADVLDRRRPDLVRLNLTGLTEADVATVVTELSGARADPALAAAIHARTGGNPLFVSELVRLLASERRLDAETARSSIPDGVRDVLNLRLQRLPEASVALLTLAAVIARPVSVALLAQCSGMDEEQVLDGCEAAVLSGLVIDDEATPGQFRLSHDLVRQTLAESLIGARQISMHAKIGLVLAAREHPSSEEIVETARHLVAASSALGPERALDFLQRAADDAMARLAFGRAETDLQRALELARTVRDPSRRAELEDALSTRLTFMKIFRGELPGAPSMPDDGPGTAVAFDRDDPAAWWGAMHFALVNANFDHVRKTSRAVIATGVEGSAALAAYHVLAVADMNQGRLEEAEAELDVINELLAQPGVDVMLPEMYRASTCVPVLAGMVAYLGDHHKRTDEQFALGLSLATNPADRAVVTMHVGLVHAARGRSVTATQFAAECVAIASRTSSPLNRCYAQLVLGWARAMDGDRSGVADMEDAWAAYRATGLNAYSTILLLLRAEAHAHHGSRDTARALVREAEGVTRATGERVLGSRLTALAEQLRQ